MKKGSRKLPFQTATGSLACQALRLSFRRIASRTLSRLPANSATTTVAATNIRAITAIIIKKSSIFSHLLYCYLSQKVHPWLLLNLRLCPLQKILASLEKTTDKKGDKNGSSTENQCDHCQYGYEFQHFNHLPSSGYTQCLCKI
jgi:hypothetical protein